MIRDYQIVSPSLDGVISHDLLSYEGIVRPNEILRVLDGPSSKGNGKKAPRTEEERRVLEAYFNDLYGVFMKKLSLFVTEPDIPHDEAIKLQALLQEMIKVRGLLGERKIT